MVIETFASCFQNSPTMKNNAALTMFVAPIGHARRRAASSKVGFEAARARRRAACGLASPAGGAVEEIFQGSDTSAVPVEPMLVAGDALFDVRAEAGVAAHADRERHVVVERLRDRLRHAHHAQDASADPAA